MVCITGNLRVTAADRALQQRIAALLADGTAPQVRHFVGGDPGSPIAPHAPGAEL